MESKESCVPPGFRFHPTDEELVGYYLKKKVDSQQIDLDVIRDIDLYRIEPWDLQECCRIGYEEQNEWYFFNHKDKKYPTGTRTNRATMAGFWKATGRDKAVHDHKNNLIGMRKTLVFYKGRAPNGQKTDWIIHEYRLESEENGTPQEEGWVVCRAFKKRTACSSRSSITDVWQSNYYTNNDEHRQSKSLTCKQEVSDLDTINLLHSNKYFIQLPQLENPHMPLIKLSKTTVTDTSQESDQFSSCNVINDHSKVTDWRTLDKFVASQLSHEESSVTEQVVSDFGAENESAMAALLLLQTGRDDEVEKLSSIGESEHYDISICIFDQ